MTPIKQRQLEGLRRSDKLYLQDLLKDISVEDVLTGLYERSHFGFTRLAFEPLRVYAPYALEIPERRTADEVRLVQRRFYPLQLRDPTPTIHPDTVSA
jgi:hypothetical protein